MKHDIKTVIWLDMQNCVSFSCLKRKTQNNTLSNIGKYLVNNVVYSSNMGYKVCTANYN